MMNPIEPRQKRDARPIRGAAKRRLATFGLLAMLGGSVLAAGAWAQSAEPFPAQGEGRGWSMHGEGGRGDGRGWRGERGNWRGERGERFARFCAMDTGRWQPVARLYIKTDLRLTPEQGGLFDTMADALLPALEEIKREACTNFGTRGATAPVKARNVASILRKAADAAEKNVEPTQRFYSSLDDVQKARVDAALEGASRRMRP